MTARILLAFCLVVASAWADFPYAEATITDLRRRHVSPDVAQATWSRYRDAVCREDALAAGADRAWETSACRAVETARRRNLLTSLAPPLPSDAP